MPLKRSTSVNFTLDANQSWASPTVYLDHWAIRKLTDETDLQDRFVRAIHDKRGTLVLSHVNIAEFVAAADPRHAVDTERFLDRVMPHVYFVSADLSATLRQELDKNKAYPLPPAPDTQLLAYFVSRQINFDEPLTFRNLLQPVSGHAGLLESFTRTNQSIADRLNEVRRDPEFVRVAEGFKAHDKDAPALTVVRELLRIPVSNPEMGIDANDGADLLHAIIPMAYCDFLLLDKRWNDFSNRVRQRLQKLGVQVRLATVHSEPGVPAFLQALERYRE